MTVVTGGPDAKTNATVIAKINAIVGVRKLATGGKDVPIHVRVVIKNVTVTVKTNANAKRNQPG